MFRPLLPPRGIFVPSAVMYNTDYPPTVIHTWIQLRGLAWDRTETPQLSMTQLSEITGKSPSTLYGHLAHLRSCGALRMRRSVKGTFILTFPAATGEFYLDGDSLPDQVDSALPPGSDGGEIPGSRNLESPDPPLNPAFNQIVSDDSEGRRGEDFNPRQGDNQLDPSRGGSGVRDSEFSETDSRNLTKSVPGESSSSAGRDPRHAPAGTESVQNSGLAGNLPPELDGAGPVKIYQKVTGIRPRHLQREHLQAHIQETHIWFASVKHWIFHGWNPKNITGMIQLYSRGGPSACRYCSKENDSEDETLSVIQQMREELRSRDHGHQ